MIHSPKSPLAARRRRGAGFTLIEIMFVAGIMLLVTIPISTAFIFVLRVYATAADQALSRTYLDKVMNRLIQDIKNNSSTAYDNASWPRLTGGNSTDAVLRLVLLDSMMGERVTWTYTRSTQRVTRRVDAWDGASMVQRSTRTYSRRIPDLIMSHRIDPEGKITGIRVVARIFVTLKPSNTSWKEQDPNNDGSFRNDRVGASLFGLTNVGDDPVWQYIVNVDPSFRNN